jgi:hypothetical protein
MQRYRQSVRVSKPEVGAANQRIPGTPAIGENSRICPDGTGFVALRIFVTTENQRKRWEMCTIPDQTLSTSARHLTSLVLPHSITTATTMIGSGVR